jgi:Tfp pilus assembly protein PilF
LVLLALGVVGVLVGGRYAWTHYWVPHQHLQAARRALDERDFPAAREHLASCLEVWPKDPAVQFLAARTERRAGNLDAAEEHLKLCERLQGGKPDPALGDTRLEWALLTAQRGDLQVAEPYLRRRIQERHPDLLLILEVMSWQLMWSYRFTEARASLDMWLEQRPEDYEALVRRAWVAEHLFDEAAALRDYRHALELQPTRDNVRLRVAELLVSNNEPAAALPEARELRQRRPKDPAVTVCLAQCERLSGHFAEAERLLDEIPEGSPKYADALCARGMIALESGRQAEAERLLRQAAARAPSNRQIHYSLIQCLRQLKKEGEIKATQDRLAKAEAEVLRMNQLMQQVMQKPHDPALRYEVGMIFLHNGFTEEGLRWLAMALRESPEHRPTHAALAEYFERVGDHQHAAAHRRFLP